MKYTCIGCKVEFKQKSDFVNHRNRKTPCTDEKDVILKVMIELRNLGIKAQKDRKDILKLQRENKMLKKKILLINKTNRIQDRKILELSKRQALTIDNSTTNNNVTNIENNVTLVNIGHENLEYIMSILKNDLTEVITDNPVDSLINCMEKIYWHKETPENHIIGYDKDNDCLLVHEKNISSEYPGKWVSKKGSFVIKNIKPFFENLEALFDVNFDKYQHLRPAINMNPSIPSPMNTYRKKNIHTFNKKIIETAEANSID